MDRDLSSVSNSSASSGPPQDGPDRGIYLSIFKFSLKLWIFLICSDDNKLVEVIFDKIAEPKRRKIDSIPKEGRRMDGIAEKKDRSSKTKIRDEQKELRREKKLGRKRVSSSFELSVK